MHERSLSSLPRVAGVVLAAVSWGSWASSAAAQDGATVRLEIEASAELDVARVAELLERDLGQPIVRDGASERVLSIRVLAPLEIELVLRAGDVERRRRADLPSDPEESVRVVVLLAANLVRDQASELIVPIEPAPPTVIEAAAPEAAPEEHAPEEDPRNRALRRPFYAGVGAFGGIAGSHVDLSSSSVEAGTQGFFLIGGQLSFTIDPAIALGVTDLTFMVGDLGGETWGYVGLTPMVELFTFVDSRVQLYGQAGPSIELAWGSPIDAGVAVSLRGGARFWVGETFTLGVEAGVHLVLTDYFGVGSTVLPQWSLPGTLGINLGWHL